jgi:predicted permease
MAGIWSDLVYAVRGLRRNRGMTVAAVLSLAGGIGANSAMFALLDAILLRPLPVASPGRLVMLTTANPHQIGASMGDARDTYSYPAFQDLQQVAGLDGLACSARRHLSLSQAGLAEDINVSTVSGNFFSVLGVKAAVGRTFQAADDAEAARNPLVVLGYGYWQRRFSGDPAIVGQNVLLNGAAATVVGVAPERFAGWDPHRSSDAFVQVASLSTLLRTDLLSRRRSIWLQVFGRLAPGADARQAEAALQARFRAILESEAGSIGPEYSANRRSLFLAQRLRLESGARGSDQFRNEAKLGVFLMMGAVGLVLAIACVNVANLLLARAGTRRREIAIRLALGAGQGRLVRQCLAESVVLGALGGLTGLWIAWWAVDLIASQITGLARVIEPQLNARAVIFTAIASLATAVLFGLAPAWDAVRTHISASLKSGGSPERRGSVRLRRHLVVTQVALSIVLLTLAALFGQSLIALQRVDSGFSHRSLLVASLSPRTLGYSSHRTLALKEALLERIRVMPAVEAASAAGTVLLAGSGGWSSVYPEGKPEFHDGDTGAAVNEIEPGFLRTTGIPLLVGRDFRSTDRRGAPRVALVNEAFVRRIYGAQSPVGRRFGFGATATREIEIVGVVRDGAFNDIREKAQPQIFLALEQTEASYLRSTSAYEETSPVWSRVFAENWRGSTRPCLCAPYGRSKRS